jgi:hypothetical protein
MGDVGSCCCSREEAEAVSPLRIEILLVGREQASGFSLTAGTNHIVSRLLYREPEIE